MRIFYLLIAFCFTSFLSIAQGTSGYSGTGANIDVDNYQIYWRINPDSALGIKGTVKIKFKTTAANVTNISFDLRNTFTVESVIWNGSALITIPQPSAGHIVNIPVNITTIGTRDSISISYSGAPPAGAGMATGFTKTTGAGGNVIYTLSESYEDRDWWPCKADMQDKADTIDISVNVPYRTNNNTAANASDTFWVASNGTLVDSTFDISPVSRLQRNRTFKYINRYPMASYLVCLGVARYNRYYQAPINIGATTPIPVVYYLYAGKSAATYTTIIAAMDNASEAVAALSLKYGKYGFSDPAKGGKHGFYEGQISGTAMEHQTFSSMPTNLLTNKQVLIHELGHQWFGDKVSFATWNDLWLAEGFAELSPSIAAETVTGLGFSAYSERSTIKGKALAELAVTRIPNSGIANSNLIWGGSGTLAYGASVYDRGAMTISMLRTMCGDTKFFNVLKDYQISSNLQYKSATTDTLKKRFADTLGINMDEFFNDNVIGAGYPDYTILQKVAGPSNKTLFLSVGSQISKLGNGAADGTVAAYFNNPVVVRAKGLSAGQDTTIVFYDWGGGLLSKAGNGIGPKISGNLLSYQLSFTPTTFFYDDSARTMSSGTITSSSVLDLKILDFNVKQHSTYNETSLTLDDNSINSEVILERSASGNNFENIGTMSLQANISTLKKYLYNDIKPLETDNYYRAKYKNTEGIYLYTKIVKIRSVKTTSFSIVNNPVKDILLIRTADEVGKDISFTIYDAAGRLIKSTEIKKVTAMTEIPVVGLHTGLYIVKISITNQELQKLKFLVN